MSITIRFHARREKVIHARMHLRSPAPRYVFEISTRVNIGSDEWNASKQVFRGGRDNVLAPRKNYRLNEIRAQIEGIYYEYLNAGKIEGLTREVFKAEILEKLGFESANKVTFLSFVRSYIESQRGKVAKSSIKNYQTALSHLERFAGQRDSDFPDLTIFWFRKFRDHLFSKDLQVNTVAKNMKMTKRFLNAAKLDGLPVRDDYKLFRVEQAETSNIYLTLEELSRLYALDLRDSSAKDLVRDMFLIGCFTGLRVSDWPKIRRENLKQENGVDLFQVSTQKTGAQVAVPVHPAVRAILEKRNYTFPERVPQYLNRQIKTIARQAGIVDLVTVHETHGGVKSSRMVEKCEQITNHTARRSFATNAFLAGIPLAAIRRMTGHASEKQLNEYIKADALESAIRISKNDFFKGAGFGLRVV